MKDTALRDDEKYRLMEAFSAEHEALPSGAFFALAQERYGWNGDDWMWYSAELERRATR